MDKVEFISCFIAIPLIIVLGLGGLGYYVVDDQARTRLRNRLEKKVEKTADINSNGLDVKEMVEVYENLGLNPARELKRRGFYLGTKEMQQYLKKMGKFKSETDAYHLKDGLGRK